MGFLLNVRWIDIGFNNYKDCIYLYKGFVFQSLKGFVVWDFF
jgi:hypothetical protein